MKLKDFESLEDYSSLPVEKIHYFGARFYKQFDYEKGLNALIEKDEDGEYIYLSGRFWLHFNYEKGLDALIKKDKIGGYIYDAGRFWLQFDYEKGLNALIQKNENGEWIYYAGLNWPQFNYEKGLNTLKRFPKYYKKALENWPKDIKQSQEMIDELRKRSKKFESKPLKLESVILEARKSHFEVLKKNKVPLTKEERNECMRKGAVWHPGNHEEPTCAIWKSKRPNGSFVFGCNTHRAIQVKPTLAGAIQAFKFIKTTA